MENNQVNTEVVEEAVATGSGKGLIIAAVVGGVILVGGIVYKKFVAPALAKRKAKKEAEATVTEPAAEKTEG